jgi:hypothetical protein
MFKDIDIFDDGWVFLLGGTNAVKDFWLGKKRISDDVLLAWSRLVDERRNKILSTSGQYLCLFAPEKLSVYKAKSTLDVEDSNIPSIQLKNYFAKHNPAFLKDNFVEVLNYLRSQSASYDVYHKTDSHWNFYGAFSVYQLIMSKLGLTTNASILQQPKNFGWVGLDLGAKFEPPLKEKVFFYQSTDNIHRIYRNELVEYKEAVKRENDPGLHVGSQVIFRNENADHKKRVLLFGDSFSEYRPHLLTGMLSESFYEVNFVWSTSLDYSIIDSYQADIVISEMAERFTTGSAPNDNFQCKEHVQNILSKRNDR